ncbi:GNAT family N-acetyltransferase [Lactiplantibacillus plajomi]|uniref:GNAT family N-acetyltransferase n=1 Tax=Lactiplantibacillus plajomi TaxID=1457217 RepID=A0ABV6JZP7_9LACO|nr:GNAT family N-acetyltransferase [Lactiplantibacillus plajomi]
MKISSVQNRPAALISQLLAVWESSVQASHHFLSAGKIASIKTIVPQALKEVPQLITIENDQHVPVGFMGIAEHHLEMLFIAANERGHGAGKALLQAGIEQYGVTDLAVNEQNPLARGFYEHMGFTVYRRSARDEQGNPYPILYMKRT